MYNIVMTIAEHSRTRASERSSPAAASKSGGRVVSLDALRGFDMFWILGAGGVVREWAAIKNYQPLQVVAEQLEHKSWDGFAFEDLIFPLFVFLVGVSLVFSLGKLLQTRGSIIAARRIILRSIALFLLGIVYNGGLAKHFSDVRLMGVLQRIALSYLAAGIMFCILGRRAMAVIAVAVLAGYWALLSFVPVPGVAHQSFAEGANWPNYVDAHYLPLHKYDGDHDPEGMLSTFPAIVTCLLGVFAGMLLKDGSVAPSRKVGWLLLAGALGVALGFAWGLQFPVIKKLWTSSYVLVAGGFSAVLLGLFYLVIDVWKLQRWAAPFVWIGMNAITLYLFSSLFSFKGLAERLIGGEFKFRILGQYGNVTVAALAVMLVLLLARFLYKRQIFLRV